MVPRKQESSEKRSWIDFEKDQISSSALRLALLAIIEKNQLNGIHGYDIGESLYKATKGVLDGSRATFYAILRKLELEELLSSEIRSSSQGPARKYYFLSKKGIEVYQELFETWRNYYYLLEELIQRRL